MDRHELVIEIDAAFSNVELEDGIGVYEAEALDNYASKNELAIAKAKDRESWMSWRDIPENVIGQFHTALCFVDAKGMMFLLPAYMRFSLEHFDTSDSASVDSAIYALDQDFDGFFGGRNVFSKDQRTVIAKFLRYMVIQAGDQWVDALVASRAYENHWAKYDAEA
ncbi:MAG: DUF6714 family protein [Candidatus Fermentibacteraceae bacterium]